MTYLTRRSILTLCFLTLIATMSREASAQVVPYKASGTGLYSPATGLYQGPGVGTHLGKHNFMGYIAVYPTANPFVFDFESAVPQDTIAANGDSLYFNATGQVHLMPVDATFTTFTAIWTGDFVVVGGTGRFATAGPAAEPLKVNAVNDPFTFADPAWSFSWELTGKIRLR